MEIAQRIKNLRESAHLTQQELADRLSISRSTLAGYESENKQPSYQVLAQISSIFKIPTDYLLGVGVFEYWDLLLKNKKSVITQISIMSSRLSSDILNGLDDIAFAKLAYAFDVHIHKHTDGTIGVTATDPIPTYPSFFLTEKFNQLSAGERLLLIFNSLSPDDQTILLGKALDLKRTSVAADEPLNKTGTDNLGK